MSKLLEILAVPIFLFGMLMALSLPFAFAAWVASETPECSEAKP